MSYNVVERYETQNGEEVIQFSKVTITGYVDDLAVTLRDLQAFISETVGREIRQTELEDIFNYAMLRSRK